MAFWNVLRIVPVALLGTPPTLGLWESETAVGGDADGLGASIAVYDVNEPTPRTNITHRLGNAAPNATQLGLLNGAGVDVNGEVVVTNIHAGLDGAVVKVWDRSLGAGASPQASMLSNHDLTTLTT